MVIANYELRQFVLHFITKNFHVNSVTKAAIEMSIVKFSDSACLECSCLILSDNLEHAEEKQKNF